MSNACQPCYHCGLDTAVDSPFYSEIDGKTCVFCCPGCEAVTQTILENGLQDYYRLRTEKASTLLNHPTTDFAIYNDALLQKEFIKQKEARLSEAEIIIDDLHCAACCWLIEKSLKKQKGIRGIQVNLSSHKALIEFDPLACSAAEIFSHIDRIGYTTIPASGNNPQKYFQHQRKEDLKRLGLAGLIMMQTGMFSIALYAGDFQGIASAHQHLIRAFSLILSAIMLTYCAKPFFNGAWRNLKNKTLGMDIPVTIALSGAWLSSAYATITGFGHVYFDSIAMFTFLLLLARYIESGSRNHPSYWHFHPSIPTNCKYIDQQKKVSVTSVASLQPGNIILISPGETIVADGKITEGTSSVDDSSITGEFSPKRKTVDDVVYAGSINHDGILQVCVSRASNDSSLTLINTLTERAMSQKPAIASIAEKIASRFTLVVLGSTCITGFIWWFLSPEKPLQTIFEICFAMLIASCPCALSLATPAALAFTHNSFRAKGVFIIKNNVVEKLAAITLAMFDKTGTLTEGYFRIADIQILGALNKKQCLSLAGAIESVSDHPLSTAFRTDKQTPVSSIHPGGSEAMPESYTLFPAEGIEALVEKTQYRIGSKYFCQQWLSEPAPGKSLKVLNHQTVWLVSKRQWLACFYLSDNIRDEASRLISSLENRNIRTQIISGDASTNVTLVAKKLQVDEYYGGLNAEQKLEKIQLRQKKGSSVMMVGDGINDAPVLAGADVSIAMANASDISKNNADILLCSNHLSDINLLLTQAKKTMQIIRQNIGWALVYNGSVLPMAALGMIPPWLAAAGMSLSSIIVILNARRLKLPREKSLHHG